MSQHVYSANCSFSGPIEKTGRTKGPVSLPCCPYCGSVLFEEDEEKWWEDVKKYDFSHKNYEEFIRWSESQSTCQPKLAFAAIRFTFQTGKAVEF